MLTQEKIIEDLLKTTELMYFALKEKDIDLVIEMLDKRELLIKAYNDIENIKVLSGLMRTKAEEILKLDAENNVLLSEIKDEMEAVVQKMQNEKVKVKKTNRAVKKYVLGGYNTLDHSKFNKKT